MYIDQEVKINKYVQNLSQTLAVTSDLPVLETSPL